MPKRNTPVMAIRSSELSNYHHIKSLLKADYSKLGAEVLSNKK